MKVKLLKHLNGPVEKDEILDTTSDKFTLLVEWLTDWSVEADRDFVLLKLFDEGTIEPVGFNRQSLMNHE